MFRLLFLGDSTWAVVWVYVKASRLAWSQGWPESRNVAPIFGYTELDLCIEWSWPLVFERFSIRFAWVWLDIDNG